MRNHRIPSRPHVQGECAPLRLLHDATDLTDGAGLIVFRRVWDRLDLGRRLAKWGPGIGGRYGTALMVEVWLVLLLYGGGVMDDLATLAGRGIRKLFGWRAVPDATTFGRWLRRGGPGMIALLDKLLWYLVRARWAAVGVPSALTLVLDSTVVLRYGRVQAGAERGYNPRKRGRPSHHPLLAFTDTGDCLGVRWRAGSAHTADGAGEWIRGLVRQLRQLGITDLTVRLDKGFFSREMVALLTDLGVTFLLKVPDHAWVRRELSAYRQSEKDATLWTATGTLYGARLVSVEHRLPVRAKEDAEQQELGLDVQEITERVAHVLSNLEGDHARDHALTVWRRYNAGATVEQRIKECYQLGFGRTAVDDLDGNAILAGLGVVAYQMVHLVRTTALDGAWRQAQPGTLRQWLFRLPGRWTRHARKHYLHLLRAEPMRRPLLRGLRHLAGLDPPRTRVLAL